MHHHHRVPPVKSVGRWLVKGFGSWIHRHRWQAGIIAACIIAVPAAGALLIAIYTGSGHTQPPSLPATRTTAGPSSAGALVSGSPSPLATATAETTATPTPIAAAADLRPPGRADAALAYDWDRQQLVLFGGFGAGDIARHDTWTWNGKQWTEQHPTRRPASYGLAAWDGVTHRVLFLDHNGSSWLWDGFDWSAAASMPRQVSATAMAWDDALGKVVLVTAAAAFNTAPGATWVWTGTQWTDLRVPAPPGNIPTIDYDRPLSKMLMYEAHTKTTWTFDGHAWTQLSTVTSPTFQTEVGNLTRSDGNGEMVLVGPTGDQTETWVWDGKQWKHQDWSPATIPGRRYVLARGPGSETPTTAFDSLTGNVVLFGGDPDTAFSGETWVWDGMRWFNCRDVGCDG